MSSDLTNSSDATMEIALKNGAIAEEVGERFITVIDEELAQKINEKFVVEEDEPIVKAGAKLFDFARARNYSASLANNDTVVTIDDDEFLEIDIDRVNDLIKQGYEQLEYNFTFAFAEPNPTRHSRRLIEFVQSKTYDRRKLEWTGVVHECLGLKEGVSDTKRIFVGEDILFLGHAQEHGKEHRSSYLVGLGYDCFFNGEHKDRQNHYFFRECMYTEIGRASCRERV